MSVAKTARAPAFLSTAMLIRPIGPQPVTTAVWPATSSTNALKTALPSGSWSAAISKRVALEHPRVLLGQDDVLGEGAGDVHAKDAHVLADEGPAGAALVARPVDDVRLRGDHVADLDSRRARATRHDDAGHLMAEGHRRRPKVLLRPRIPALDVDVRAAHARRVDTDEELARAGFRDRDLANGRTRCRPTP